MRKIIFRVMILMAVSICLFPISAVSVTASESDAKTLQAATMMEALDKVNVRVSPDTESDVLGQLEQGERLFAVELTEEGWYRVVYQGETGYVRGDFLKIYSTEDWDISEGSDAAGPSGDVIDPEEEVRKASEEAAQKESEAIERAAAGEASAAAAAEAKAQAEAAQKRRSRNTVIGVFAGAVLLIVVYAIYVVIKEMKNPEEDGEKIQEDKDKQEGHSEKAQQDAVSEKTLRRNRQKKTERGRSQNETNEPLQENSEQDKDMEFLDLDV